MTRTLQIAATPQEGIGLKVFCPQTPGKTGHHFGSLTSFLLLMCMQKTYFCEDMTGLIIERDSGVRTSSPGIMKGTTNKPLLGVSSY